MIGADTRIALAVGATPPPPARPICPTCTHLHVVHGHDHHGRPLCRGNSLCGCAREYRPENR